MLCIIHLVAKVGESNLGLFLQQSQNGPMLYEFKNPNWYKP